MISCCFAGFLIRFVLLKHARWTLILFLHFALINFCVLSVLDIFTSKLTIQETLEFCSLENLSFLGRSPYRFFGSLNLPWSFVYSFIFQYTKSKASELGLKGWVKNTDKNTVLGCIQSSDSQKLTQMYVIVKLQKLLITHKTCKTIFLGFSPFTHKIAKVLLSIAEILAGTVILFSQRIFSKSFFCLRLCLRFFRGKFWSNDYMNLKHRIPKISLKFDALVL